VSECGFFVVLASILLKEFNITVGRAELCEIVGIFYGLLRDYRAVRRKSEIVGMSDNPSNFVAPFL
jgi:hypothetical protein